MATKGKLITLEGIDGVGKGTQLSLIAKKLDEIGMPYKIVAFPRYDNPSSYFIKQYLSLDHPYGTPDEVGPYRSSIFYAMDRYDASFELRKYIDDGFIVLADRYTGSNIGHQGGKISDEKERKVFIEWLFDLEFVKMGIPKPDVNIILSIPLEVSVSRIESRGRSKDAHEVDPSHLGKSQDAYLWAAKNYPDDFVEVKCVDGGRELNETEVYAKVWKVIEDTLNK